MEGNFTLDSSMLLAGLAILPVFAWFALRRMTLKLFLFGSLLLLVFSRGTLELLGISTLLTRVGAEALVLACFILVILMSGSPRKRLPGLYSMSAFVCVALLTLLFNEIKPTMVLLFFRDYLFTIMFFYAAINASFNDHEVRVIGKVLVFLFLSQIAANIIKVFVLGDIVEPYIGTMANLGGSLTIIFAMVGSVVSIALYLNTRKYRYVIVLIGFIAFSIIGGKRAALVYIPLIYLVLLARYQLQSGVKLGALFKQGALFVLVTLVFVYISLRLMPSLNPEREVWGTFDIEYAMDYGTRYVTTGSGAIATIGRAEAPAYLFSRVASDSYLHLFIGYGAGHLIKSRFNPLLVRTGDQSELSKELYGVGYGARTAFLQLFLQVGIVGVFFYLALWVRIFKVEFRFQRRRLSRAEANLGSLVILGVSVVFLIDFFTYSVVFVQLGPVSLATAMIVSLSRHKALIDRRGVLPAARLQ
ncbi:hypothetical protein QQF73_06580 [Marinobacter sp. M216]|uniref:O-antigen ligase domain-containing protein n=1 Tax=Marinobacter albus TaxID=3030833 RepID=A0ABT7HAB6_9GAMM|nr:hypothetical protein [Marinobacter sp. M216]MDK9557289.1 hypothetical protein [Marinobacter sp. M216]